MTNIIGLKQTIVQNFPSLLSENPNSFAKKLRILKLGILGLERNSKFDPNEYKGFFISSPATLMAKKLYYIRNGIDPTGKLNKLLYSWKKIIIRDDNIRTDRQATDEGRRLTRPFKQNYDRWMTTRKYFKI